MEGKILALPMAAVRLVPVETSCWIFSVAMEYTELPEAPPTESRASTSGTPAANIVDRVRVQRATQDLSIKAPKIGIFNSTRSMNICIFSFLFQACMKKKNPPPITPKINHHHFTKTSLIPITKSVGAGRSAPNDVKTSLNAGIPKSRLLRLPPQDCSRGYRNTWDACGMQHSGKSLFRHRSGCR